MKIAALIPAYQPDEKLIVLLKELSQKTDYSIIVVNDGSRKECDPIFKAAEEYSTVISYEVNRGKGAALKTGISYIIENTDCDGIVTLDADGQHTVSDTQKTVDALEKNPGSFIVGGRAFTGNVPARSKFGNTVTRLVFKLSTGASVRDTQTGLRAFSRDVIKKLGELNGDRYEYEMNVLLACTKKDIPIHEIPIETIYIEENKSSHFNPLKDSWKIYKLIIKFAIPSLLLFVLASGLSWAIDTGIYYLMLHLFGDTESVVGVGVFCQIFDATICFIIARVISAPMNYFFNKVIVFRSKGKTAQRLFEYCLLAAGILVGGAAIMSIVENTVPAESFFAPYIPYLKHVIDVIMFAVSWFVQRLVIFKRKRK